MRLLAALVLLVLTVLPATAQTPFTDPDKLFKTEVIVDGAAPFYVDSIYPDRQTWLEADGFARGMRWTLTDRVGSDVVFLEGKRITKILRYKSKTYLHAGTLGALFGFKVSEQNNGTTVRFSAEGKRASGGGAEAASPPLGDSLSLRVLRHDKQINAQLNTGHLYRVDMEVKNLTDRPIGFSSSKIFMEDSRGTRHYCVGGFQVDVAPRASTVVERVFFQVDQMVSPEYLGVEGRDGSAARTRW